MGRPKRTCTAPGCERPHHAKGLCQLHRDRRLKGRGPNIAQIETGIDRVILTAIRQGTLGPTSPYAHMTEAEYKANKEPSAVELYWRAQRARKEQKSA